MGVKMVGASVRRMEDPRLLRGEAAFVDDIRFPGLQHMAVLRSPHAHARIRSVDVSAAREMAGVVDAFSAAGPRAPPPGLPLFFSPGALLPPPPNPPGPPPPPPV